MLIGRAESGRLERRRPNLREGRQGSTITFPEPATATMTPSNLNELTVMSPSSGFDLEYEHVEPELSTVMAL